MKTRANYNIIMCPARSELVSERRELYCAHYVLFIILMVVLRERMNLMIIRALTCYVHVFTHYYYIHASLII